MLEKNRRMLGWSTVVPEGQSSVTDFGSHVVQLEESEETRRLKRKTLPRNMNRKEHDARRTVHLQRRLRADPRRRLATW